MKLEPYDHDCPRCLWGGWINVNGRWGNLYFCPSQPETVSDTTKFPGSVLIRFSNEVNDYWSVPIGNTEKGALMVTTPNLTSKSQLHCEKSKGHIGFFKTPNGWVELYEAGDTIYRAPIDNAIEWGTGYRFSRPAGPASARELIMRVFDGCERSE